MQTTTDPTTRHMFTVEVEVERTSGNPVSIDVLEDAIKDALENIGPSLWIDVSGYDEEAEYECSQVLPGDLPN